MKFYYDVIESHSIDVDFQEVYDFIKEQEDSKVETTEDMFYAFADNTGYYLRSLYNCEDLVTWDNESAIDELVRNWERWLEEKFGEIWE